MASGWGYVLGEAAYAGLLCFGRPRGAKVTFVRPDRWLGPQEPVEPDVALAEVCSRYMAAYGPARPADFGEWFGGLNGPAARELFESLGSELEEVDVEGRPAWSLAETEAPTAAGPARLLPEYDAYVMGFRERDRLVPEPVRAQLRAHPRGRYEGPAGVPLLVVDGRAAGVWRRERRGRRIELAVEPAEPLDAATVAEVEAEADRIGRFLGAEPRLTIA